MAQRDQSGWKEGTVQKQGSPDKPNGHSSTMVLWLVEGARGKPSLVPQICLFALFSHILTLGLLFLGGKKITIAVTPPPPTQQRSLPVQPVFRAILEEVEKADTRFSLPILEEKNMLMGTMESQDSFWKVRKFNISATLTSTFPFPCHDHKAQCMAQAAREDIRTAAWSCLPCGTPPCSPECPTCKNICNSGRG